MQRVAELIQRQRLHVEFEVGRGLRGIALQERAQLRGRHGQGASAMQRVFKRHLQLAPPGVGHGIEGEHVLHLERGAKLQVVLQVFARRQVVHHRYAMLPQQCARSDAGELQDLRTPDRARGEYGLALGCDVRLLVAAEKLHAENAPAGEAQLLYLRAGNHGEVGPVHRRAQERLGAAHAHAAALVYFELRTARIVAAIEIIDLGDAGLKRGIAKGIQDLPGQALALDAPLMARAFSRAVVRAGFCAVERVRPAPQVP